MYKVREIETEHELSDGTKEKKVIEYDFGKVDYDSFDIKVNIGSAAYWSELMQVQTLDAFFSKGIIDDALIYLEHIPEGYVSGKEELIKELKAKREKAEIEKAMVPKEMSMGNIGEVKACRKRNVLSTL